MSTCTPGAQPLSVPASSGVDATPSAWLLAFGRGASTAGWAGASPRGKARISCHYPRLVHSDIWNTHLPLPDVHGCPPGPTKSLKRRAQVPSYDQTRHSLRCTLLQVMERGQD